MSLVLSSSLLTTGCVPHKVIRILPQVTLSDTRTKRNLAVGQVFFEGKDGQLTAGPNLQSLGLLSHSVPLGPVSVNQPDITLAEFLNAIGAGSAGCESALPRPAPPPSTIPQSTVPQSAVSPAALPQAQSSQEGVDWFGKDKDTIVGEDVSLLLEDVSEELADPKSLTGLFKQEDRRSGNGVPWAPSDNGEYQHTFAVVQALYARQAVLRFRVPEKSDLSATGNFFLGHPATTANDRILTLIKMASACGAQGHARELPDPGFEVNYASQAPMSRGVTLVRDDHGRPDSVTPVETKIIIYEQPRLPTPSFLKARATDSQPVWNIHADGAQAFLQKAKDQPLLDDGRRYLNYCANGKCDNDAVITTEREFKVDDARSYDNAGKAHGCVFGQSPRWWNLFHDYKAAVQREVALRELVLFFGAQPKDTPVTDFSENTSEIVHRAPYHWDAVPHSGPTTEAWIYEYNCQGGLVESHPAGWTITNQGVYGHLKGWELDH